MQLVQPPPLLLLLLLLLLQLRLVRLFGSGGGSGPLGGLLPWAASLWVLRRGHAATLWVLLRRLRGVDPVGRAKL
jgi:hypothetical protein